VYHFTKVTPSIWILKSLKQTINSSDTIVPCNKNKVSE